VPDPSPTLSTPTTSTSPGPPGPEAMVDHPLAALSAQEVTAAVQVVRSTGRLKDTARFAYVGLAEPDKASVRAFRAGDPVSRRIRMIILPGPELVMIEAVVSLPSGEVEQWDEVEGMRPALMFEESIHAIDAVYNDPQWQEAMHKRGITDFEAVQLDPWPAGNFGLDLEHDRRICRCLAYLRDDPTANGYARPIEGVIAFVDMGRGEVIEVVDTGVVPLPPERGSYYPEDNEPLRHDLRPVEITQPDGPSFTVDGNLVRWQKWSVRVSMDPYEGLVLHTVTYDDAGQTRPILHRASVSEMVVPYGDPGPLHGWKNAFDAGEWGLGRMANSLTLGCDCLGEIHYFDAVCTTERGDPYVLTNAICMHEEDYGIGWKHVDMRGGRTEVRRSRRLVVSSIATVGNYEYGFYWYFYLDGTIQLEVKLTGILSTMAVAPGEVTRFGSMIAPQLAAPVHQHLFNVRLDVEVDGETNSVEEVEARPLAAGPDNPWGNAFEAVATLLRTEQEAKRVIDPARSRHWRIVNRSNVNRLGRPVAYKLLPGATPTLLADEDSPVGRRANFATRNLWVTPFSPTERRAAGEYPNQHAGGDGLPKWTAADRDIVDTDIVVWHTFGVTHLPRPEDWPVMPVEYAGFSLIPVGFFDRNPALDVPPTPGHCHAD
jgi:primary-amine oxidase